MRRATRAAAACLLLAGCGLLPQPDPIGDGVPILVVNEDDESATLELRTFNAITQVERVLVEPFELAPGETYDMRMEPTFAQDAAYHLLINGFVALSSAFACGFPPTGPEGLPKSVRIVVMGNGEPAVCPFVGI